MNRNGKALALFRQYFNCSQAVFAAYRPAAVPDEKNALNLSAAFGAGLACTGDGLC